MKLMKHLITAGMTALFFTTAQASNQDDFKQSLQAAEKGDVNAQLRVGEMYRDGEGVEENGEKALFWFEKSGEAGNGQAQLNAGTMYFIGDLIPGDGEKAKYWFDKACKNHQQDACSAIETHFSQ